MKTSKNLTEKELNKMLAGTWIHLHSNFSDITKTYTKIFSVNGNPVMVDESTNDNLSMTKTHYTLWAGKNCTKYFHTLCKVELNEKVSEKFKNSVFFLRA